jgi:hypothetical protein
MASDVQICNMALSHIGSDARVTSIRPPDGSVEAGHCATFYDLARTELLEPGNWAFSLKRATLAQVTNTSQAWAYAYTKPSDCLRPLRIPRPKVGLSVFALEEQHLEPHVDDRDSAQFDVEGDVIFTNYPDATLVYVRDITDSTKFSASFTATFSFLLAGYLAGPVIKGNEGARLGDAMRQRAMSAAEISATASANASSAETDTSQPSIMAVRA